MAGMPPTLKAALLARLRLLWQVREPVLLQPLPTQAVRRPLLNRVPRLPLRLVVLLVPVTETC
jgi:hypothetical protein